MKKYFISGKIYSTNQINDILLDKDSSDIRTGWRTFTMTGTKEEFSLWVDKFLELSDDTFKLYDCGEVKEKVEAKLKEVVDKIDKPIVKWQRKKRKSWEDCFKK